MCTLTACTPGWNWSSGYAWPCYNSSVRYINRVTVQSFRIYTLVACTTRKKSRFQYTYRVLKFKFSVYIYSVVIQVLGICISRYNWRFGSIVSIGRQRTQQDCWISVSYVNHWSSWAQVDSIKAVKCWALVYKRRFQRFLGAYSLTKTHAMTVVGRQNMCGVPVYSVIQNTSMIQAVGHKLTA